MRWTVREVNARAAVGENLPGGERVAVLEDLAVRLGVGGHSKRVNDEPTYEHG